MALGENGAVLVFLLLTTALVGTTLGAVHNVGGSAGWTIIGNVDYKKWASGSTFHVGDSLAFVYNSQFHNVKQMSRQDFLACNASSPVATYTSGSDTVTLKRPGHYYFLCGFPGHCQAGQRLHVLVTMTPTSSSVPRPSSSPMAAAAPSAPPSAIGFQSPGPAPTALYLQSGAVRLPSTSVFLASVYGALVVLIVSFM